MHGTRRAGALANPAVDFSPAEVFQMPTHKYKVGQSVEFTPIRSAIPSSSRAYTIVRLLPADGGEPVYRIKSITEPFERIAQERELSSR
jgi:hypothetical protein